jgi:hypothetical protein
LFLLGKRYLLVKYLLTIGVFGLFWLYEKDCLLLSRNSLDWFLWRIANGAIRLCVFSSAKDLGAGKLFLDELNL